MAEEKSEKPLSSDIPKLLEFLAKHEFPIAVEISDGGREVALKLVANSQTKLILHSGKGWKVV